MAKLITNNESSVIQVLDEGFFNIEPTQTFVNEIKKESYITKKVTSENLYVNKEKLMAYVDLGEGTKVWFHLESIDEFNKMFKQ